MIQTSGQANQNEEALLQHQAESSFQLNVTFCETALSKIQDISIQFYSVPNWISLIKNSCNIQFTV